MSEISKINVEQKLYVLRCNDGFTCHGFDNVKVATVQIAGALKRDDLMPSSDEYGTEQGYAKYRLAVQAWGNSVFVNRTWFEPGTADAVQLILEKYRRNRGLVRLFLGDASTGRDWMEESDVVGYVGRSTGVMKIPLLMLPGESCGLGILTACVLRIMDVMGNKEIWRSPVYQVPNLSIEPELDPAMTKQGYAYSVFRDDELQARFRTYNEATDHVLFSDGRIAATREHLLGVLRNQRAA